MQMHPIDCLHSHLQDTAETLFHIQSERKTLFGKVYFRLNKTQEYSQQQSVKMEALAECSRQKVWVFLPS